MIDRNSIVTPLTYNDAVNMGVAALSGAGLAGDEPPNGVVHTAVSLAQTLLVLDQASREQTKNDYGIEGLIEAAESALVAFGKMGANADANHPHRALWLQLRAAVQKARKPHECTPECDQYGHAVWS